MSAHPLLADRTLPPASAVAPQVRWAAHERVLALRTWYADGSGAGSYSTPPARAVFGRRVGPVVVAGGGIAIVLVDGDYVLDEASEPMQGLLARTAAAMPPYLFSVRAEDVITLITTEAPLIGDLRIVQVDGVGYDQARLAEVVEAFGEPTAAVVLPRGAAQDPIGGAFETYPGIRTLVLRGPGWTALLANILCRPGSEPAFAAAPGLPLGPVVVRALAFGDPA